MAFHSHAEHEEHHHHGHESEEEGHPSAHSLDGGEVLDSHGHHHHGHSPHDHEHDHECHEHGEGAAVHEHHHAAGECCHAHVGHHHGHHHGYADVTGAKLLWTSLLNITFTVIEVVGGIISNSLSLLSDALHNLADSSAIFLAYVAHLVSKRKPDVRKTFGYKRFEIIAAFINAVILIGICLYLFVEAYRRFMNPEPIKGLVMLIVAIAGLLANLISVIILHSRKGSNLNVRAAYLHLMGDTLSSVAVILGGLCIWLWNVVWVDPLITVLVGIYIIWHTWGVLRESTDILMQGTPPGLDLKGVAGTIEAVPGVKGVHHMHAWRLNDAQIHLEAHVDLEDDLQLSQAERLRAHIADLLREGYGIAHITLQMEHHPGACELSGGCDCLPDKGVCC